VLKNCGRNFGKSGANSDGILKISYFAMNWSLALSSLEGLEIEPKLNIPGKDIIKDV
jgi:hypothetical protein